MKAKQKRTPPTNHQAHARRVKKEAQAPAKTSAGRLDDLYARLNQTEPGSEESKRIADQIVNAIG